MDNQSPQNSEDNSTIYFINLNIKEIRKKGDLGVELAKETLPVAVLRYNIFI